MAYTLINITHARRHESIARQKAAAPSAAPFYYFYALPERGELQREQKPNMFSTEIFGSYYAL